MLKTSVAIELLCTERSMCEKGKRWGTSFFCSSHNRWLFLFCRFVPSKCELRPWLRSTCLGLGSGACGGSLWQCCCCWEAQMGLRTGPSRTPEQPPPDTSWSGRDPTCWSSATWPEATITLSGTTPKGLCWERTQVGWRCPGFKLKTTQGACHFYSVKLSFNWYV